MFFLFTSSTISATSCGEARRDSGFPTVKLLDYQDRWDDLENSSNPFAAVVIAHIKAVKTGNKPSERYRWKLLLIKRLYKMGYDKRDVVLLFEFIDWVMSLPKILEDSLWLEIQDMERETKMEYISSVQRIGREQGISSVLERQLSNYKIDRDAISPIFEGLTADQIEELAEFFVDAQSLDEIRARADELRKSGNKTSSD